MCCWSLAGTLSRTIVLLLLQTTPVNWCFRAQVVMVLQCCSRAHAAIVLKFPPPSVFYQKMGCPPSATSVFLCARIRMLEGQKVCSARHRFCQLKCLCWLLCHQRCCRAYAGAHFRPERTVLFHIRCKPKYACACTHGICMRSCVVYPISCNCFLNSLSVRILNIFCKPVSTSSDPKSGDTIALYHTPPLPPETTHS